MKRIFLVLALLCLLSIPAWAIDWSATYEAEPAAGDPVSQGDDEIREEKLEARLRNEIEHSWGSTIADDNGLHRVGSARVFVQDDLPDNLNDMEPAPAGHTDYDQSGAAGGGVSDFNDGASQTSSTDLYDDIGHGRVLVDQDGTDNDSTTTIDNNEIKVYVGVAGDNTPATITDGWEQVRAIPMEHDDDEHTGMVTAGAYNLVYNGHWTVTDGTGSVSSTSIPDGWTVIGAATYTYDAAPPAGAGDGVELDVTSSGGTDRGIQQSLTNLKASTTYRVVVQGRANAATDVCSVDTSGASTDMTDVDIDGATSTALTTATGTFVTAAALDTVTLRLFNEAAGDVCHWTSAAVYEVNDDKVAQPGNTACYTSSTTGSNDLFTADSFVDSTLTCAINIPGPGYIIEVDAKLSGDSDDSVPETFFGQLMENVDGGGTSAVDWGAVFVQDNDGASQHHSGGGSISFHYLNTSPAVGSNYVYTMEGAGSDSAIDFNQPDVEGDENGTPISWISVRLIPTR